MKTMNLWPAVLYHIEYALIALAWTFGIVGAISIAGSIFFESFVFMGSTDAGSYVSFNAGAVALVMFFIFGVGGTREDLRFFLQNGMGRRTTYWSTIISALISGAAVGLLGEGFNLLFRLWPAFPITGMNFNHASGFFIGWLMHIGSFFFAWQLGALFSLIYYRMNKNQQIVFSVALAATFVIGLPRIIIRMIPSVEAFEAMVETMFYNFFAIPSNWAILIFALGVLAACGNFFLIRGANVKE